MSRRNKEVLGYLPFKGCNDFLEIDFQNNNMNQEILKNIKDINKALNNIIELLNKSNIIKENKNV